MPTVDVFVQEFICTFTYAMNRQIRIVYLFAVSEVLVFVCM
jgi:hypothetical protein